MPEMSIFLLRASVH